MLTERDRERRRDSEREGGERKTVEREMERTGGDVEIRTEGQRRTIRQRITE